MKITFGGVRGTSVAGSRSFLEYGTDTTSFLVAGSRGEGILVDVGSGARALAPCITDSIAGRDLLVLMTHYHLDHVFGLPMFPVIYRKGWSLEFAAPRRAGFSVGQVIRRILGKPFWPVPLSALPASVRFRTLPGRESRNPISWGGLSFRWCPVNHPGECTAYRIDETATGRSVLVATDIEWATSTARQKEALIALGALPRPVNVLVFDGQFTPANYERFRGWGHSTWLDGVNVARKMGAERLAVTHHAPESDDEELDRVEAEVRSAMPRAFLAREGMRIEMTRDRATTLMRAGG